MSNRMPFTDLVTDTFDFGFHRYFTVFKLMILPILIFMVGGSILYGIGVALFADVEALAKLGEEMQGATEPVYMDEFPLRVSPWIAGAYAAICVFVLSLPFTGACVRLFRLAGRGEEPKFWETFRFDRAFWLTVASIVLLAVLYGAIEFLASFIPSLIDLPNHVIFGVYLKLFIGLGIYIFYIILQVRMTPLHAATANEVRIPLVESWEHTHGYFWTIFWAQALLIFMVVGAGFIFFEFMGFIGSIGGLAQALNPAFGAMNVLIVIGVILASFFFIFFAIGVLVGFPAMVYRKLWLTAA